jgi:V/A-type H+-transporting ATPase subunit G/H
MKSIDDNIETLSRAILNEARTEADQVLAAARSKADEIRRKGEAQAAEERSRILERARQEVGRVHSQAIANARLKARSLQYQRREQVLDRVFESAREQISGILSWSEYEEIAAKLVKEGIRQINSPRVRVRMDTATARKLNQQALAKIAAEMNVEIEIGKALEQGTGVIVESETGRMVFDNTLENRLNRLQNTLRSPVYQMLSGEKL